MVDKILPIGVDDGHSETKIIMPNGARFRVPSQAISGKVNLISINGDESGAFGYETPEGHYVAGNIPRHEPTNTDDYPVSVLNRVIVTHALQRVGDALPLDSKIAICTGLPLKRFYVKGKPNAKIIKSKTANLLKNDIKPTEEPLRFEVVKHNVFSEGVAAWVDFIANKNASGKLEIDSSLIKKRVAIVDFGGRTLDVAVVSNWQLDAERSGTFDIGMLAIRNDIIESVYNDHEVTLTEEQIVDVLRTKKFKLYGKEQDAQDYIRAAESQVINQAKTQVMRLLGKAGDIDEVLFVGGTSAYLEPLIGGWYPHQRFVKDPAFANARGYQKFMEIMGS